MTKKFFVTTPVYYPNEKLHIGHAYTTILADYINKYKKMQGYETMFLTGSDEHGQKIYDRAQQESQTPYKFVTSIVNNFKKLWKELGIDYDVFIRTTDKRHETYVKNTFTKFLKNDFIYKDKYTGLYCKSDESYFTSTQSPDKKCPICGSNLKQISESSYFLKVSKFKKWIEKELLNTDLLEPKYRVNELINNFIKDLKDLSITRTSFDWGIKINEDNKYVVYVWLDALLNYISALTFKESKFTPEEVWSKDSNVEILQLVGKEITRFHCIYWPMILKIKNYRNPQIFAHGWLVADDGNKMSKSKGNTIDPIPLINNYGRDALRFYLVNNIITGEDGKFSQELLEETINGLLVNKYSNLVARTDAMVKKYFNNIVPKALTTNKFSKELNKKLDVIKNNYFKSMDKYKFSDSTKLLINYIEELNGYIDITEPWKKSGDNLSLIINTLVNNIFNVTLLLSSLLIDSSKKVYNWLCVNNANKLSFKDLNRDFSGVKLNNINYLFTRIEKKRK